MKNLAAFIFLKNYGAARKYTLILNRKKKYMGSESGTSILLYLQEIIFPIIFRSI